MGGAWASRHFLEHYWYTGDKVFLEKRALPILRDATLFLFDWLVADPKTGKLVSGPSASPENQFIGPDGKSLLTTCFDGQARIWPVSSDIGTPLMFPQLETFAEAFPLTGDVRVVVPETTNLLAQVHEFLSFRAKSLMRVQTVNMQTSETSLLFLQVIMRKLNRPGRGSCRFAPARSA